MPDPRSVVVCALAVALALAFAPTARAASADPLGACFLSVAPDQTELVPVGASGFTPGAAIDVRIDGAAHSVATADGSGRLAGTLPAPFQARRERSFTIDLIQRHDPANAERLRSRVTALSVSVRPRSARPSSRVRWTGRGFLGPGPVYAHYVKAGHERRTIRLARPRGACGRFSVRHRQFPFRPSVGRWTVQVDQRPAFAPAPHSPFVRFPITVRRVDVG